MRSVMMVPAATLCLVAAALAEDAAIRAFRYRPGRFEVGSVFHYVKSNWDGSHPDHVSVYLQSPTRIDALKRESGGKARRNGQLEPVVINSWAEMNWKTFSGSHLEMLYGFADGSWKRMLFMDLSEDRVFTLTFLDPATGRAAKTDSGEAGFLPAHVYGIEFLTANFTFPHLVNPEKEFEISLLVMNPAPTPGNPHMFAAKRARIRYVREEMRHHVACRRYHMEGDAVEGRQAVIWVNTRKGYIEDMENPVPNSPDWTNFKFELQSVERMDAEAWRKWKAGETARFLARER